MQWRSDRKRILTAHWNAFGHYGKLHAVNVWRAIRSNMTPLRTSERGYTSPQPSDEREERRDEELHYDCEVSKKKNRANHKLPSITQCYDYLKRRASEAKLPACTGESSKVYIAVCPSATNPFKGGSWNSTREVSRHILALKRDEFRALLQIPHLVLPAPPPTDCWTLCSCMLRSSNNTWMTGCWIWSLSTRRTNIRR